jgi:hypothetical protein
MNVNLKQAQEISKTVDNFPIVGVNVTHSVVGSDKIVEADIVSVFVEIKKLSGEELETKKAKKDKKDAKSDSPVKNTEAKAGEAVEEEEFDIDSIPLVDDKKIEDNSKVAIAPRFPFGKAETWIILVFDENSKKVLNIERCSLLENERTVEVKVQAPSKGTYDIAVYIKSDSYRGLDKAFDFKMVVAPRKEFEIQRARNAGLDPKALGLEEDAPESSDSLKDEEPEAKWYYLYTTSIWEMLLLLFLIYMGVLFGADWLHTRGYISRNPFRSEVPPAPTTTTTESTEPTEAEE